MEKKNTKFDVIDLSIDSDKKDAWKNARDLEERRVINDIEPEGILELATKIKDERDRALFCVLYLTAARVEEVVRYQKIKWGNKKVIILKEGYKPKKVNKQDYKNKTKIGMLQDGLKKKDIKEKTIKNIPCVMFTLRNLKNRKNKLKIIPVRLDNEVNKKLYHFVELYTNSLEDWRELFPFEKRNAERIINKLKWNPHSLRKARLTHLFRFNNYTDHLLMTYAGWTDTRPSNIYVKTRPDDLIF
jgi:integrase